MFALITKWLKERRVWRAEHQTAWRPVISAGADQLTPFQYKCKAELIRAVPTLVFEVRKLEGERELYLVADLPGSAAKVFIYENGSSIHAPGRDYIAEEWDFKSPDELIQAIVTETKKRPAS